MAFTICKLDPPFASNVILWWPRRGATQTWRLGAAQGPEPGTRGGPVPERRWPRLSPSGATASKNMLTTTGKPGGLSLRCVTAETESGRVITA